MIVNHFVAGPSPAGGAIFRDRLTVGQRSLKSRIEVRIFVSEHIVGLSSGLTHGSHKPVIAGSNPAPTT